MYLCFCLDWRGAGTKRRRFEGGKSAYYLVIKCLRNPAFNDSNTHRKLPNEANDVPSKTGEQVVETSSPLL